MVEMDTGSLKEQWDYLKTIGIPYSAIIFSGNKSLHTLISLDRDVPSQAVWRLMAEWTLNSATLADPATKNPSRSIRIPGALRDTGKRQLKVDFRGVVKTTDFAAWLGRHPEAKPRPEEKRQPAGEFDFGKLPKWVTYRLKYGLDPNKGRNQQWFGIAFAFQLSGYEEEAATEILSQFFTPEHDFSRREFLTTIESAYNKASRLKIS
jgi:hypothetical protein